MNISKTVRGVLATVLMSASLVGAGYMSEVSGVTNFTDIAEVHALGGSDANASSESMSRLQEKVYDELQVMVSLVLRFITKKVKLQVTLTN